ncbi:hypothetical protein D915_009880 [Fasciola hepatica]|uniref:LITAF domain-containing protein n=1 Tax=Fasciola hepatica TaxID=6192 RepID=A0A4E0R9K3_FASHE|nr:hypothetical protein D915_009880 [Fasciola hepatica]
MSHRPSLYGYPPPTTKLSLPLGTGTMDSETASAKSSFAERGSIQEEPRASFSKPKLGGSSTSEDKFKLGREPVAFRCQTCQQPTMTVTSYHVGVITWIAAVFIFLCGGILGCFLIPFYTNCCKDVRHTCPVCETEVGTVKCI